MNTQLQWEFGGSVPEHYESYLVPSIFGPWAHDLVEMAALHAGERVLDIACGTGIVARTAAKARRRRIRRRSGSEYADAHGRSRGRSSGEPGYRLARK